MLYAKVLKHVLLISCIVFLFNVSACDSNLINSNSEKEPNIVFISDFNSEAESQPFLEIDTMIDIDSSISLDFRSGYSSTDLESSYVYVSINQKSDRIFGAYNLSIINEITINNNSLHIDYMGIGVPHISLPALGPARNNILLKMKPGIFQIIFSWDKMIDTLELTVSDSSLIIDSVKNEFTNLTHNKSWRMKKNSFAYMGGSLVEDKELLQQFIDFVNTDIMLTEFTFPKSDVTPYPRASMGHYYDAPTRYFHFKNESDFLIIGELFREFAFENLKDKSGIGISLYNWDNSFHFSWMILKE